MLAAAKEELESPCTEEMAVFLDALVRHLKDKSRSTFLLVLYPEYTPIFEAKRASVDLRDAGIEVQGVIANFVLEERECTAHFAASRYCMQQHDLRVAAEQFPLPMFRIPMLGGDLAGREALVQVARELFGASRVPKARTGSRRA